MSRNKDVESIQDESVNRRKVLSVIGTGMVASAGTGVVSGNHNLDELPDDLNVEELQGGMKRKYVNKAVNSSEFRDLIDEALELQPSDITRNEAVAFRFEATVEGEYRSQYYVRVPLPKRAADALEGVCGHHEYDFSEDEITNTYAGVSISDNEINAEGYIQANTNRDELFHCAISVGPNAVTARTHQIDTSGDQVKINTNRSLIDQNGGVSTQSCGIDAPDIDKCNVCKKVVDIICRYGCWLGTSGICSIIGLVDGTIGSVCEAIAVVVCKESDIDCERTTPAKACYKIDFCDSRPL